MCCSVCLQISKHGSGFVKSFNVLLALAAGEHWSQHCASQHACQIFMTTEAACQHTCGQDFARLHVQSSFTSLLMQSHSSSALTWTAAAVCLQTGTIWPSDS